MLDLVPWLIGLALVALIALLYWADRRYPAPTKPSERDGMLSGEAVSWMVLKP